MSSLERARYAALYGPTTGDRVRLADTDLYVEVTEDLSMGSAGAATRPCSAAARSSASRWGRRAPRGPRGPPTSSSPAR
ncbi:hypothetical protein GCM10027612_33890 [Microbispora bryophytorum subsp. camponoti]